MSRVFIFVLEVCFTIYAMVTLICLCVYAKKIANVQPGPDEEESNENEESSEESNENEESSESNESSE